MYSLSALFLLAQAPPWMFTLVTASVAALATLAATGITLFATHRREQKRLEHESEEAWRVERRHAYSEFFALARHAKQTLDWSTSKDLKAKAELLEDLREAHAAVALVVEKEDLSRHAYAYYEVCKEILQEDIPHGKDLSRLEGKYKVARNEFLESARVELGLPPHEWGL
jgi:hypothetical protein